MAISCQKRIFCQFLFPLTLREKHRMKKSPKSQNLRLLNFLFCLVYFVLKSSIIIQSLILSEKYKLLSKHEKVSQNLNFLSPRNYQKSKISLDCSSNFWSIPPNLPFWAKIFTKNIARVCDCKITVLDKMLQSISDNSITKTKEL